MALADFQASLGRLIRVSDGRDPFRVGALSANERASLTALTQSPGFQFTVKVQRSWCAGRAGKAAFLTLSILPEDRRKALLDAWVDSGGGTLSFSGAESAAFLTFIARRLPQRSPELATCQFEIAALRVAEGMTRFEPPDLSKMRPPAPLLRRGRYAGLVIFQGAPDRVLKAMVEHEGFPKLSQGETALIFGPGLDGLYRIASGDEIALFERLATPAASAVVCQEGWPRELIDDWLRAGIVEYGERSAGEP